MTKVLHILNGDSTKQIFEKSTLEGDQMVWREMICEGKLTKEVGSDEFWRKRYEFFENELGLTRLDYYDKSIKEILKLQDVSAYDTIVLWFEFDLFCQVNLMAACSYLLKSFRKDIHYYLVCTGKEQGKTKLQTLSDYTPEAYETLYLNKIKLTRNDFLFAEKVWKIYVENEKKKIETFDFSVNKKLIYLHQALQQHLQRFPGKNGLNQIENMILNLMDSGVCSKKEIIKSLLEWQKEETVYGFGDLQYEMYLKNLDPYYSVDDTGLFSLNSDGKKILKNKL